MTSDRPDAAGAHRPRRHRRPGRHRPGPRAGAGLVACTVLAAGLGAVVHLAGSTADRATRVAAGQAAGEPARHPARSDRSQPAAEPPPDRTVGSATSRPGAAGGARTDDPDTLAAQVIVALNARRAEAACAPVRAERRLTAAARAHSADMAARSALTARSARGEAPWEQAWARGYYFYAGETIARGQLTAAAVVDAWMAEPQGKRVILDCGSQVAGVGVRLAGNGPWWTAMFGYRADGR